MIAILRLIARQRQHLVRRRGEKKGMCAGCIVGIFEQSPCELSWLPFTAQQFPKALEFIEDNEVWLERADTGVRQFAPQRSDNVVAFPTLLIGVSWLSARKQRNHFLDSRSQRQIGANCLLKVRNDRRIDALK